MRFVACPAEQRRVGWELPTNSSFRFFRDFRGLVIGDGPPCRAARGPCPPQAVVGPAFTSGWPRHHALLRSPACPPP